VLDRYIGSILRDFVESWYLYLGPDEKDFLEEARIALEHVTVELNGSLCCVSLPNAVVNLIHMFQRHIKTFDECQAIIQEKYPNLKEEDFSMLISELYEEAVVPHIATHSKGTELDYLKSLIDMLLHKFVPHDTFSCLSGRFLLREILATQCVEPLVGLITNPNFINEIVIDILEPSLPLATILKQWEDAMKEIEDEEGVLERLNESGSAIENGDVSSPETNYESTHEHAVKTPPRNKKSKAVTKQRSRRPQGRSKSRNNKKKKKLFDEPDMSDLSDSNDDDTAAKDMIRFDKLDMKTSYPVYGSTSARDHEKSTTNVTKTNALELPLKRSNTEDIEQIDSGRASYGHEPSPLHSEEDGNAFESPTKENGGDWAVCPPPKAEIFRHPSFYGMPLKQDNMTEQFKAKVNSTDLPKIFKQMSTGNCRDPCMSGKLTDSCSSMDMHIDGYQARNFTRSIDGSVTMDFSSTNTKKGVASRDTPTATSINLKLPDQSEAVKKDENEVVRVHKSGEEGSFYEVAPSCPTCIEMTLLASPFQNEKAQIVLSEKEIKDREKIERWKQDLKKTKKIHNHKHKLIHNQNKKIEPLEHTCGLDSEHFCNAQADTESFTIDPISIDIDDDFDIDGSSVSRSNADDEIITDHSVSSGTLLASFEESMKIDEDDDDDDDDDDDHDESSFYNISEIYASRSDVSSIDLLDTSTGFDYEVVPTSRVSNSKSMIHKKSKQRKLSHAISVQTFKTAIEGESVLDEHTRQRSMSSTSLDVDTKHRDKGTLNKQFLHFFKKGSFSFS